MSGEQRIAGRLAVARLERGRRLRRAEAQWRSLQIAVYKRRQKTKRGDEEKKLTDETMRR